MTPLPSTLSRLPPTSRPLHVLYAEDMFELRQLIHLMLTHAGHRTDTASDGREAHDLLVRAAADYDLLITDHHMPHVNGLELVEQVRKLPFRGKIIVFTSEADPTVHGAYRRLNVDLIIAKPIFPLKLRAIVEKLFAADAPPAQNDESGSSVPRPAE